MAGCIWHENGTWEPMPDPPKNPTQNFCSECGAKLGENGRPVENGRVRSRSVSLANFIAGVGSISEGLLHEEAKPEPAGNFKKGDIVRHKEYIEAMVVSSSNIPVLSTGESRCNVRSVKYDIIGVRYGNLRHVHKCDDGRTCNCATCNPCGKADDLDCTCEKCCPRTLDGLVDLFGADVVRERIRNMGDWSFDHADKWLLRMTRIDVHLEYKHPLSEDGSMQYRGWNPEDPGEWMPDEDREHVYRIHPRFYRGDEWKQL